MALIIDIQAITEAEKQQILDDHNYYRANVAMYGPPPATPLPALIWDDDLATVAQNYVNKCPRYYNEERAYLERSWELEELTGRKEDLSA